MDIKINGSRLKNMFSYDWIKILISIVAGVVVWTLLFTMLGTRATVGEQFYFTLYDNVRSVNGTNDTNLLKKLKDDGIFSYDVLSLNATSINDAGEYSAAYMLNLRLSTFEGDVIIISDGRGEYVAEGSEIDPTAEMQNAVDSRYFYNIETFLSDAEDYCFNNGFITVENENYDEYTVNKEKIEKYFRQVRLKSAANYRKTFRTEAQIKEGVELETVRIENIYKNWLSVTRAIKKAQDEDNDFLWYGKYRTFDKDGKEIEDSTEMRPYGIDLYKLNLNSTDAKIEDVWYTYTNNPQGEGPATTTEGLVMCVFNFKSEQKDMQYESLAFLRYIIETYSNYI